MPVIRRQRFPGEIQVDPGTSLMKALLSAKVPVASSCGGDGVCAKCAIKIVMGMENLSPVDDLEMELLQRANKNLPYRISCQTLVQGDVTVDALYW